MILNVDVYLASTRIAVGTDFADRELFCAEHTEGKILHFTKIPAYSVDVAKFPSRVPFEWVEPCRWEYTCVYVNKERPP